MAKKAGYRSKLSQAVDELQNELGFSIPQRDIAVESGVTEGTMSAWMKTFTVRESLRLDTLYAITQGLNAVAEKNGSSRRWRPEDLVEFVNWSEFSNKVSGLSVSLV